MKHLFHCPFTGLGLFGGFRGQRWLKNRIKIFKQFVVPSLLAQTSQNFILWMAWRYEEKNNPLVKELKTYLEALPLKTVFTYSGICFYDDKYEDKEAKERLINGIHGSMGELLNALGECDDVLMTIQPSDDCYHKETATNIQNLFFKNKSLQAIGFRRGYIMNYQTKEIKEWNPKTNPPFYTIKFPREIFIDPFKHADYTGLKRDVGQYKKGTPIPSHEYVGDALTYGQIDGRGFLVGVHGENISTVFNHPYAGEIVSSEILKDFGLENIPMLKIKYSLRKRILKLLPYKWQRKIRYWFGEKFFNKFYNFLRR